MQRLGKNAGGYRGEVIDINAVLRDIESLAKKHGWDAEIFYQAPDFKLIALHRNPLVQNENHMPRIYISAGIHGDEPAAPLGVLELLRENRWPENAEIWILPCLNPAGFIRNTRENIGGLDLNRDYLNTKAEEIRAHIAWLQRQPRFNVCVCMHEDWESNGFYVYELNPDNQPSAAESIIERVAEVCPIDMSPVIEDRPALGGIIRPLNFDPLSRPQWPEALYLITHKTRLSYTIEAPSDFPLPTRVAAEVNAVRAVLDLVANKKVAV